MSTKLKLLGVDVASFGDAMGTTPDCLEVVVNDAVNRPTPSWFSPTMRRRFWAASWWVTPRRTDSAADGRRRAAGDPMALIAPAGSEGGAGLGVGALPAAAQICSCNNVTKGDLTEAIAGGCCDVPAQEAARKAGTSCGSCVPLLKQLLEAEGVEQSKALCEHFSQSRASFSRSSPLGRLDGPDFSALIERFGTGKGCDICKPAVASILASTSSEHILDGEQASLQDSNDHFLANIQKNGSYSVVPRVPGRRHHRRSADPDRRDRAGTSTSTPRSPAGSASTCSAPASISCRRSGGRLVEGGMESGHAYGKALRTVKSCVGSDWCRYGQQDSVRWPSTSSCVTAGCGRRTRSRWASRAARVNARRRAARTSASSPPRLAGTSTSAATAA